MTALGRARRPSSLGGASEPRSGRRNIRLRTSLPGENLHVPHLFDVEVLHVPRRHSLGGTPSESREHQALSRLHDMRLSRYPTTLFCAKSKS